VANSISLALEDPTATNQSAFFKHLDNTFLGLYTAEMVLKICGMGFFWNQGAYLRDAWNILDFIIVAQGYFSLFASSDVNLQALRSFRVLRPLRTISNVEGLRILVSALISALPLLRDTIIVLLFFFVVFAIAGVQIWAGELKQRCFNLETGIAMEDHFCGSLTCPGEHL